MERNQYFDRDIPVISAGKNTKKKNNILIKKSCKQTVKKNQYFDREIPVILAGENMEKNHYFDRDIPVISAVENM